MSANKSNTIRGNVVLYTICCVVASSHFMNGDIGNGATYMALSSVFSSINISRKDIPKVAKIILTSATVGNIIAFIIGVLST